ncbi:MAG: glycerophosphodiester phosphodiesterase family protein [Prolixibacteraceae bacterium]
MSGSLIIAHRGESFDAPENTLAAINLAWARNSEAVEIDIHMTKDNKIVVIHDDDTLRVSGKKKVISNSTFSELQSLDVGSYKNPKWQNERIPTLNKVLKTIPVDGKLIIEIKSDDRILKFLKTELSLSKLKNQQIILIAFNVKTLAKAKKMMPEYKMLWLLDLDYTWPHWMLFINKNRLIRKVKSLNLDGINVWAGRILNCNFIEKMHHADLLVFCWTIDQVQKANTLAKCGIDGITSNRASWLKQELTQI